MMTAIKTDALMKSQCRMEVQALLAQEEYAHPRLERYGFKVFSQNDEDGIIQEIFRRIGTTNRCFFEFGSGNCIESNCAYLALQGWSGAWIDANNDYLEQGRKFFKQQSAQLTIKQAMIYATDINEQAASLKLPEELDLLSIDIDGNDYYVWEALTVLKPRVVVIEYNASWFPPLRLVQAHDPGRSWDGTNYFGASLNALVDLGQLKGYTLVGTNLPGVNAFFVRSDIAGDKSLSGYKFSIESVSGLFNPSRFSLGEHGFPVGHPPGNHP